jgi:hypothetical protein
MGNCDAGSATLSQSAVSPCCHAGGAREKKRGTVMNERGEVSGTSAKNLKEVAKCLVLDRTVRTVHGGTRVNKNAITLPSCSYT